MIYKLTWLPEVLRASGLKVVEVPRWQDCGHGDMGTVKGVLIHHTAGCLHQTQKGIIHTLIDKVRPDVSPPLANLALQEDGTFIMIAAGRAYHAGKGKFSGLTKDDANRELVGIECANTGLANDPWDAPQMDALKRGVSAILNHLGAPSRMALGHKEWAPTRKIDPSFDMAGFRLSLTPLLKDRP